MGLAGVALGRPGGGWENGRMTDARRDGSHLPLAALASQLLVAFIIELDNEFERQMPHRTTKHGSTPGTGPRPWPVSMAMWAHCMRFVPEDGIPAGELARRACLSAKSAQMVLKRMSTWWGYLVVVPAGPGREATAIVLGGPALSCRCAGSAHLGTTDGRDRGPLAGTLWRRGDRRAQQRPGGRRQPPQRRHARLPPHRGTAPGVGGDGRRRARANAAGATVQGAISLCPRLRGRCQTSRSGSTHRASPLASR